MQQYSSELMVQTRWSPRCQAEAYPKTVPSPGLDACGLWRLSKQLHRPMTRPACLYCCAAWHWQFAKLKGCRRNLLTERAGPRGQQMSLLVSWWYLQLAVELQKGVDAAIRSAGRLGHCRKMYSGETYVRSAYGRNTTARSSASTIFHTSRTDRSTVCCECADKRCTGYIWKLRSRFCCARA